MYRNGTIGWGEKEFVPGFALLFGEAEAGEMKLGWKSGNGGKGPLLPRVTEAGGKQ
jgi:hypothetical protein